VVVTSHAIGSPEVADVVQHQHGAAPSTGADRGGLGAKNSRAGLWRGARIERHFDWLSLLASKRGVQLLEDSRLADGFHIVASKLDRFEIQHVAGRIID